MNTLQVLWFAKEMEAKLEGNSHKGGWEGVSPYALYAKAEEEMKEVFTALLACPRVSRDITRECADTANFLMMIADNCRRATGES